METMTEKTALVEWGKKCLSSGFTILMGNGVGYDSICKSSATLWANANGVELDEDYDNFVRALFEADNDRYGKPYQISKGKVGKYFPADICEDIECTFYKIPHDPEYNQKRFDIIVTTYELE